MKNNFVFKNQFHQSYPTQNTEVPGKSVGLDTARRKGEHLILDFVSPGRKPRSFPNGSAGRKKTNLRTCVGGAGELRNCAAKQSSFFSACLYSHLPHFQSSQPLPHSQHRLAGASRSDTKEERLLSSQQLVIFALRTC